VACEEEEGSGPEVFDNMARQDSAALMIVGVEKKGMALIEGGRFKKYADDSEDITRVYWHQPRACTYEVLPGPGRLLRWSVPVGRGHDDLLISTALAARLDQLDWRRRTARGWTRAP
jgi:hypothetical protein